MQNYNINAVVDRIERMAAKVYRNNKNSVIMLINDLENFFEIDTSKNVDKMTTDEFASYIAKIRD
jgi:hypothetical protein